MALATPTYAASTGGSPSKPILLCRFSGAGDSAYPTGGSASFAAKIKAALDAAGVYVGPITSANIFAVVSYDCGGYKVVYDHTNDKLKVEYADLSASSDGPDVEVANSTDLSAVTFRYGVIVA